MKPASIVFAAALLLLACGWSSPSDAGVRAHFGFGGYRSGSGVGIYINPRPRAYHGGPSYRHRPRRRRGHPGRCGHWHDRCAANWGHRNRDYRGCMRHHGC